MKNYFVYIATNPKNKTLYTGITNNLDRRMHEHKAKLIPGFTSKYNINKLIYYSKFSSPKEAISAEKKIKEWTRIKKIKLIESQNPQWSDLTE